MSEPRNAFEAANRPTIGMAAVAAGVLVVVLLVSTGRGAAPVASSQPPAPIAAPPRRPLDSPDALRTRLLRLNPDVPPSKAVWSPVLRDERGAYRAMWFGHASRLRADLAPDGGVESLTLHTPRSEDRGHERLLASMMLDVAAPKASAGIRSADADALGALMSRSVLDIPPSTTLTAGDVVMKLDVGALDLDLTASPREAGR